MKNSSIDIFFLIKLTCIAFVGSMLNSCAPKPIAPVEYSADKLDLIPRNVLLGIPSKAQARLSSDGEFVSWLAPHKGTLNIWVAQIDKLGEALPVTNMTGRGIRSHSWSRDSKHVLFEQDNDGDQNYHIYATNVITRETRDITPVEEGVQAQLMAKSWLYPDEIIVSMNLRDRSVFDLYRVTVSSGERQLVAKNDRQYSGWITDQELEPKFGIVEPASGGAELVTLTGEVIFSIPIDDYINSYVLGGDQTGEHVLLLDSRDRKFAALTQVSTTNKELDIIAEPNLADIDDVLFHPTTFKPIAYAESYLKTEWAVIDSSFEPDFQFLRGALKGSFEVTSKTKDMSKWIVYAESAESPGTYFIYDRENRSLTPLFAKWPELEPYNLQPMHAFEIQTRDGLKLVSYLTLPPGSDPDRDGSTDQPLPLVLNVHGGPWSRDSYGYDIYAQWLSNRGYAVLSVNYRGSLGFGKEFLNAGIGEFAGKMHHDLIDGVEWAISNNIADPDHIAIMGGSYGGYAALVGLTFTPDVFACGVDRVGISNLVTAVESFPDHWKPFLESDWYRFVGNPAKPDERAEMLNKSPISRVDDIVSPLLITQGENDPRVVKAESDQMVSAMTAAGKQVTYLNFPDEGHGIVRTENRLANFAITEHFLANCLGGKAEPIGESLNGSSLQILTGGEFVDLPHKLDMSIQE